MNTRRTYVLDTSVAVKWFANEGGAEQAKADQLLNALDKGECILKAPELLLFEVANALTISHKFPSAKVIDSLTFLRKLKIEVELLNWSTLMKAVEIASACGATIYDSYFLAVALGSNSVLITADHAFLRKARHIPHIMDLRIVKFPESPL